MEPRNKIGLVIPTLANRPDMLIRSFTAAGAVADEIVVVAPPKSFPALKKSLTASSFTFVEDPGKGLAAAINLGFERLSEKVRYAGWLGDDDGIYPEQYLRLVQELETKNCAAVYGDCDYISAKGTLLGTSSAGNLASRILGWGPDLIPQPTTIFRFEVLKQVGLLDHRYGLAFDYDLMLRLKRVGSIIHLPGSAGFFTWHADSLSVSSRWESAKEAQLVRVQNSACLMRAINRLTGPVVMVLTVFAGKLLNALAGMKRE